MDPRVALMIGCPKDLEAAVHPLFRPRLATNWRDLSELDSPALILIGPEEGEPELAAEHLAKKSPASSFILYVAASRADHVNRAIDRSPAVPIGTKVLSFPNFNDLERAVNQVATRLALDAERERNRRIRARSDSLELGSHEPNLFYRWYVRHRAELTPQILETILADPGGATLLALIKTDQLAGVTEERQELERRAFEEGDVEPFLDNYRQRGRHFAEIGVSLTTWLNTLGAVRRAAWEHYPRSPEFAAEDVAAFAEGLEIYSQLSFGALLQGWQSASREQLRRLHERERLYTALVESSQDVILSKTLDGTITAWNQAAEELYGYSTAEALGSNIGFIVPDARRGELEWIMREVRSGRPVQNLVTQRVAKDGQLRDVAITVSPIRNNVGEVVAASTFARNVSERLRLERRNAAILAGALDAIITIDDRGRVVEFNAAAQALLGYTAREAVGKDLADLVIPEPDREAHRAGLARQRRGAPSRILGRRLELNAVRKSGAHFPVEASIVRLAGTEPPLFTAFLRDLTELKRAKDDLKRIIADLTRSNSDLEQFAYVASHDLQEPLRMVSAYMDLLQRDYADRLDERALRFVEYAVSGGKRMKELIDDLLAYSRLEARAVEFKPCDTNAIAQAAVQNLRQLIDERSAQVSVQPLPTIYGESTQLLQVFQNLIGNGVKFHRQDVPPEINVSAREAGDEWLFCVHDNGVGFDARFAERIFQMFQRLHPRTSYPGSGIGLAVAKRIIERHGGRIWAESEPGQGTLFYFTLPLDPPTGRHEA